METVIVLKNLAYASDGNAGTVDKLVDTTDELVDGAIGIYNEAGDLLADVDTPYVDCKELTIAWNKGGVVRQSKGIVRKGIARLTQGAYVAPVMHKVVVGGTTEALSITMEADAKGHVGLRVADNTFSGMFATNFFNASVYKKASMSVENVVDALVAKLNANTQLPVTAVKIASGSFFGITVESKTRGQILSLSTDGLLEDAYREVDGSGVSVLPINGSGVGVDVLKHEEEASVYLGNGNYRELGKEFYSSPMTADAAGEYKTIVFQEHLGSPYLQETNVRPEFTIYIPEAEDTNLTTSILEVLGKAISGIYTAATTIEPGTDGDPGNTDGL